MIKSLVALVVATGCGVSLPSCEPKPPCEGLVVVVEADAETPCDLVPPQQLTLRYPAGTSYTDLVVAAAGNGGHVSDDPDRPTDIDDVDY